MAGMCFVAMLVSINYFKTGGVSHILHFAVPYILGVTVFLGLVYNSRGDVHLYDAVTNQTTVIGDVPDVITLPMTMINSIERYVVDIIDTTMAPGHPDRYGVSAGGIYSAMIYQSLAHTYALYGDNNRPDSYLSYSLQRYIEDCMFFANQAGNLSIDDVKQKSVDFNVQLEASVHNSIYTIVQKDADGWRDESNSLTCYEAWYGGAAAAGTWDGLRTYLIDSAKFNGMLEQVCSSIGYDVSDAQEKLACQNMMGSLTDFTHGGALSMSWFEFIRQIFIAHKINEALTTYAPGTTTAWLSNLENMSSTTGIAVVANQWMPVIKGVVTGVAFFLTPFIIMFFTTHIFPRALLTVMMFFIWITLWTIMDVGMHGFAMDYAYNVYQMIRANNSLAYDQIMMMPDAAVKGMAVSGIVRSSSMMLATVFTGLLFKGYATTALAALSGNLAGHIRNTGSSSGSTTMMPEKAAGKMAAVEVSVPTIANAAKYNFSQRTTAGTYSRARGVESGLQTSEHFNGAFNAAMKSGHATATKTSGDVAYAGAVGGPSGLAGKREMDGLGDKAYTDRGYDDRHDLARIGAQSKYHSQREHPAEVLARAYSGLFPDKDSAHKAYARMKASRDFGWYGQAHTMAMAEMARKLGFTADEGPNKISDLSNKSKSFLNNLKSGDAQAISNDFEQRKAFEDLTGESIHDASHESMQRAGSMLQQQSLNTTINASDTMGTMFPARYAAEKHKMDYMQKHHGVSDLQSMLAFNNSVEALKNTTNAEAYQQGMRQIANDHFGGNIGKASAAISDSKVFDTMGFVGKSLDLGSSPGDLKYTMGQVQANIETGTQQAFNIVGDEGLQQVSRFKNLDSAAKSEQAQHIAATFLKKAPSDVTGEDILQVQKGHHGNNWVTTNESGSQSFVMSPEGNVLFSISKQVSNSSGVGALASQIESSDPKSAQKLRELLNNSNQNLSYEVTITQDAQGNLASFTVSQDRVATSNVVMQSSEMSTVKSGSEHIHSEVNKVTISGGTVIDQSTAFQMALKGDEGLVKQVTNPYLGEGAQDAEIAALSNALGSGASQFMSRQGVSADYARGEVGGGFGVGSSGGLVFGRVGASGATGGERRDIKSTNLMTQQYDDLIRDTLHTAREQNLTQEQTRDLLNSNIENYTNALYREVQNNKPDKFGASSVYKNGSDEETIDYADVPH
jgi:hypothetical protein